MMSSYDSVHVMETGAIGNFNAELVGGVVLLQERVETLEKERNELARKLAAQEQSILYYKLESAEFLVVYQLLFH